MAVVKINAIEVPAGAGEELESRFAARQGAVENSPGFLGFELLRPVAGDTRYFVYTRWESEEAYQAWAAGPSRAAHAGGEGEAAAQAGRHRRQPAGVRGRPAGLAGLIPRPAVPPGSAASGGPRFGTAGRHGSRLPTREANATMLSR